MQAHPGKAIILGRFYTVTRALVPFVAGTANISRFKFFGYSVLSAAIWAMSNIALGYIAGHGFKVASRYASMIFVIVVVAAILGVYLYRQTKIVTTKYWHVVDRYQIYPLIATFVSLGLFAVLARMVISGRQILVLDYAVARWFGFLRNLPLTDFFVVFTYLMTPLNLILVATALTLYFAYRHRWYYELLLPVALLGGAVSDYFFNMATQHPRPLLPLIEVSNYSFPSGHATIATIFFMLMIYFFAHRIRPAWLQLVFVGVNVGLIVLVCISRLYLNVHWFSDVISGVVLGIFWIGFSMIVLRFLQAQVSRRVAEQK
jgi:undecaprenyl-diphosphatase